MKDLPTKCEAFHPHGGAQVRGCNRVNVGRVVRPHRKGDKTKKKQKKKKKKKKKNKEKKKKKTQHKAKEDKEPTGKED